MSSEIVLCDGDVRDELARIERAIDTAAALPVGAERREAFAKASSLFNALKRALQNYQVELRGLRAPEQRTLYESILKEHLAAQKALETRLQTAQKADPDPAASSEIAATHQNYTRAIEIQRDGLDLLRQAAQHGAQAEGVASHAQTMLAEQTERIGTVQERSRELVSNIKRAQRDVIWFMRTAATDKCLLLLFGALVLTIIGVVVWHVWLKGYLEERGYNPLRLHPLRTATPSPIPPPSPRATRNRG
eukprot:TRINITY_DN56719_c0_g1_i1.p1 TRINITY_DN56719_c0_g1~~TRINITY_DN56719_c0_g1_i1.p1  ORF type:complete len:248 (+),score=36.09 TRINITY_DN56719_c0_g1_i1:225-968(+)